MNVRIEKGRAQGKATPPTSKSAAHRLLIAAALAEGKSEIKNCPDCEDVRRTTDCLIALGVNVERTGSSVFVTGKKPRDFLSDTPLFCGESGSTLRFLIPVALLTGKKITFTGEKRLFERPLDVYEELCEKEGFLFEKGENHLTVQGDLQSGKYTLSGSVSSQFITGLLFALAAKGGESEIEILPPVESRSYIGMTVGALRTFGADVEYTGEKIRIGNGALRAQAVEVEGDWSGAAFLYALAFLGDDVKIEGIDENGAQGDKACLEYFRLLQEGNATIDLRDCPDLAPVLFAFAAANHGGRFIGTARLKIKESDRSSAMRAELQKCGVCVCVKANEVIVGNGAREPNERIYGHNDHRIVMAMSVLLTRTGGEIEGAEAVKKSYPLFFETLESLGIGVRRV